MQDDPSRSITGRFGILHKHHCLHGPFRSKAEQDGLYVMLTVDEHRRLHDSGEMDLELKQAAQRAWMEKNGSTTDFIARYGKNYL